MATIVVGFVDNPPGNRALELAIEEARRRNTGLIVVHSLRGGQQTTPDEINASRKAMERVETRLRSENIEFEVETFVRGRAPSEDLLEVAAEQSADLIVVGYQKRSTTGKLLLGSTPLAVMLGATCPVLAVSAS
ncbi:MAG: universal stress protein [Acidimicrobiia bacterium]